MAFYGLNFGEKATKSLPMKPRGIDNRSFIKLKDEPRPVAAVPAPSTHADPTVAAAFPSVRGASTRPSSGSNPAPRDGPEAVLSTAARPHSTAGLDSSGQGVAQAGNGLVQSTVPPQPSKKGPRPVALVFQMPSAKTERELFDKIDNNGNGLLSLAELDKAVVTLWPKFDHKPAIMRAYRAADVRGTGMLSRAEFSLFLRFLVRFSEVWCLFSQMDENGDRRLTEKEFLAGANLCGFNQSPLELKRIFAAMDDNHGGFVLFDEFCHHIADAEIQEAREALRAALKPSRKREAKKLEFLALPSVKSIRQLFDQLDVNRNNKLSLAELDKAVVELWPQFNNKPAIMRAYKAADLDGSGLLGRREFTAFLQFLVVYENLWQQFEKIDENGDRRISRAEFLKNAPKLQSFDAKSPAELEAIFAKIDVNGGGFVLFDEFCAYAALDVVKAFIRQSAAEGSRSEATTAAPIFELPPCGVTCHCCGKQPADLRAHLGPCTKDYEARVKLLPSFLQRPAPTMSIPLPASSKDVERYNVCAKMVFDECALFHCPECAKPFHIERFLGHFKTHNISYNRRMELQKMAPLNRPNPKQLNLPPTPTAVQPQEVAFDVKLQCTAPFDLTKLSALRRQLYISRVRSPQTTVTELAQILASCGVKLDKERVAALLGGERGSMSEVMAAIDQVGISEARRKMVSEFFQRLDTEKQESVEYRHLRQALPDERLQAMFARPLEKHVSAREFESILSDLSILYARDEQFRALFEKESPSISSSISRGGGASSREGAPSSDSEVFRLRVTLVSGEIKVVEVTAAAPPVKKDPASLKRRLSLLGISDVQKVEVVPADEGLHVRRKQ